MKTSINYKFKNADMQNINYVGAGSTTCTVLTKVILNKTPAHLDIGVWLFQNMEVH